MQFRCVCFLSSERTMDLGACWVSVASERESGTGSLIDARQRLW